MKADRARLSVTALLLLAAAGCQLEAPARVAADVRQPPQPQGMSSRAQRPTRRAVPLPAAASVELQQIISEAQSTVAGDAPASENDWRKQIDTRSARRARLAEELAAEKSVTVEKDSIAGVDVYYAMPPELDPRLEAGMFIYLHGGAYVYGGGPGSVFEAILIAADSGMPAIAIDYRKPPDHPFPTAVEDVIAVYRVLLRDYSPASLAIGGTSAGGGLALAAVHRMLDLRLPLPGALYAGTPWADLTDTSDSLHVNENIDRVLPAYDGLLHAAARLYVGDADMIDPLVSPVYGDFAGFPPTWIVSGTRDILLSDAARVHRKLRNAGVLAELNVFEGMSHAGYLNPPDSPESAEVYAALSLFLREQLK